MLIVKNCDDVELAEVVYLQSVSTNKIYKGPKDIVESEKKYKCHCPICNGPQFNDDGTVCGNIVCDECDTEFMVLGGN